MKSTVIAAGIFAALIGLVSAASLDTARIDELTGLKGKFNEKEGVYKVTFPRNDVKIVVDGWTMPPFMGLGTWAAFTSTKDGAMVMGDTVLFEDEVNAAMSTALDNGLNVTALHNHFFFDHPKVYFMHIEGEGAVDKLASAVRKVYDAAKQIRAASPNPKGLVRRSAVAGEKFNYCCTSERNLWSAGRIKRRNGQVHVRPTCNNARRQDRQHHGREHLGRLRRQRRQRHCRWRLRGHRR